MNFSIIIPTYNSENYLPGCLDHVDSLNYDKEKIEVIIVDGGSSDRTTEIAHKYNAKVIPCDNVSVSNSRNVGAEAAKYESLVFIDSDCLVNPDLLMKSAQHLLNYSCVGSYYAPSPNHGWIAKTWLLSENRPSGEVRWLPAGTLIIKAAVFSDVGGFNERYIADEDVELCRRIRLNGYSIYNDKTVASVHLGQSDSINKFMEKEMWHASSNFQYLKDYGLKEEKFSVVLNLFFGFISLLLVAMVVTFKVKYFVSVVVLCLLMSGMFSAIKTFKITRADNSLDKIDVLLKLYFLFNLYLAARYFSIFKYKQYKVLFV